MVLIPPAGLLPVSRSPCLLILALAACHDASAPAPPPAPNLALLLAEGGQDPTKLCALVREHPNAPEGQAALARVRAIQARDAPVIAAEMDRRGTEQAIRRGVTALVQAGASAPCERYVSVFVEREVSPGPDWGEHLGGSTVSFDSLVRNTPVGVDTNLVADDVARALDEIGGEWLVAVRGYGVSANATGPRVVVKLTTVSDGMIRLGDEYRLPRLAIDGQVEVVVPPSVREQALLPRTRFQVGGLVEYTEQRDSVLRTGTAGQVTVDRMLREIAAAMTPVPQALGLAAPDPALAPWHGRHAVTASPTTDTCGGSIAWGAPAITIHAGRRTLEAEGVNRTYRVHLESGVLIAHGEFDAQGMCPGSQLDERWELAADHGTVFSTWRLADACDRPCTARFDITLSRAEPGPAP